MASSSLRACASTSSPTVVWKQVQPVFAVAPPQRQSHHRIAIAMLISATSTSVSRGNNRSYVRRSSSKANTILNDVCLLREEEASRSGVYSARAHGSSSSSSSFSLWNKKNLFEKQMHPRNQCGENWVPSARWRQQQLLNQTIIPSKSVCFYGHQGFFTIDHQQGLMPPSTSEPSSSLVYFMDSSTRRDISSVIRPQIDPSPDVKPSIDLTLEPDLIPPPIISPTTAPTTNPDIQQPDSPPSEVPVCGRSSEVPSISPVPIREFDPLRGPETIPTTIPTPVLLEIPGGSPPSESPIPSTLLEIPTPIPSPPSESPGVPEISRPRMQTLVVEASSSDVPRGPPIAPPKVTPNVPPGVPAPSFPPQSKPILPLDSAPAIPIPQTPITPPGDSTPIPPPVNPPPPGTPPLTPPEKLGRIPPRPEPGLPDPSPPPFPGFPVPLPSPPIPGPGLPPGPSPPPFPGTVPFL